MTEAPQGKCIWGLIYETKKLYKGIYIVYATKYRSKNFGFMVKRSVAKKYLSTGLLSQAKKDGDWICFETPLWGELADEVQKDKLTKNKKI